MNNREHGEHRRHHEPGFGGGPHGRGSHRGHGRGPRRTPRGNVRAAILLLLAESPMHGYQLMQTISERTCGAWSPSPGTIYPTLSQLEDEGMVEVNLESGRKLARLTNDGEAHVAENRDRWPDPFPPSDGIDLKASFHDLGAAVHQVAHNGTQQQRQNAADLLSETRRRLYLLLAEETL